MIVKNEEEQLEECLNSASTFVDEMIIVDTGSTDKTMEIAKRYTSKVYKYEWCDDFSTARNFSISKASNNWILVLDADEKVVKFNTQQVKKQMEESNDLVGRIKIRNCYEMNNKEEYYTEQVSRLFNRLKYNYTGRIHEQITPIADSGKQTVFYPEIVVEHDGYLKEKLIAKNKIERNIKLLTQAIDEDQKDVYLYYQLGKTYYSAEDYEQAKVSFEKALALQVDVYYDYTEDLIESYAYTLINTQRYKEALFIVEYEDYFHYSADFYFLLGLVYMNNAKFVKAEECFYEAVQKDKYRVEGTNSYKAYYNIGVVHEVLGRSKEAKKAYLKASGYLDANQRAEML